MTESYQIFIPKFIIIIINNYSGWPENHKDL